ncbi:threonylcarbamoyl-AMP synthase [Candidatus Kaiserbacteria bacterium]|nr:MAG: threonylcarbamoyl-AMP synthase [Candidatus Kaiserbacteria bacterium]
MTSMIDEAAEAVRRGELIVFPTDTVYGIGCDPFDEESIKALFDAKKRAPEKDIPVLVDSIETAEALAEIPTYCIDLLEKHWPGALTVIVKKRAPFPKNLAAGDTIALRQPDHEDLLELLTSVGGALAATSANISGKTPLLTYDDAYATFSEKATVILPGKVVTEKPSTIIDCTGEEPVVVREGPVSIT